MSISLDKLKALRKQAGHAEAIPAAVGAAPGGLGPSAAKPTPVEAEARPASPNAPGIPSASESPSASQLKPLLHGTPATPQPKAAPREDSVFGWVDQIRHKPATPAPAQPSRRPQDVDALRRLLVTRNRAITATQRPERSGPIDRDLPGTEVAPGLHLVEAFLPQPIPHHPLSLAFARRPDETVAPRDLLFFDTETTGLAGGTGTRAFMVGAADWHHDAERGEGLRVRQLLIATLGAEAAMLDAFAEWLQPTTVLSSFNGRSYDAPLLKTRYRLARRREPLGTLEHIDLLHPARRQWRGHWENCRLATIERNVLGIVREDDLPGSQAPAAWLNYLRGGSAHNLRRVGEHNHQDVVTLAQLFLRLVEQETRATEA